MKSKEGYERKGRFVAGIVNKTQHADNHIHGKHIK